MVHTLAAEVILWTTGGLPKPFEAFLPPVTCRARLTQKGWRETFHAEHTSHFCLCASSANLQWIHIQQSAHLGCLANNWQKVYKIAVTGQIYFLF